MKTLLTHTNERYSILSDSSDFLNLILSHISTCVMLLDKKLQLRALNNPLNTIFSNTGKDKQPYQVCGDVIKCAHLLEENSTCGTSSNCKTCELRILTLQSYAENKPIVNKCILKPIINSQGKRENRYLQFSTKLVKFHNEKYILAFIDDITEIKKNQIP